MILGEPMDVTYVYTVEVMGCDFIDGEWSDEHEFVCDIQFDTEKEAVDFLFGITKEQALEWEQESRCNALDIIVLEDPVMPDVTQVYEINIVATCEWIGDGLNGIWLGDGEERIG